MIYFYYHSIILYILLCITSQTPQPKPSTPITKMTTTPTQSHQSHHQHTEQPETQPETQPQPETHSKIKTHHCRFCNHLLLATTRDLASLPRRSEPGRDGAVILPLPSRDDDEEVDDDDDDDEDDGDDDEIDEENRGQEQDDNGMTERTQTQTQTRATTRTRTRTRTTAKNAGEYSILLSTALPDRRAMLVRREDGFEKRTMLRCGRCRVVVGYFLDGVHFSGTGTGTGTGPEPGPGASTEVVYLLPGALMETGIMGDEERMKELDREWSEW